MPMESVEVTGKTVLVTGGTGFAGAHLVEELLARGNNVITTYLRTIPGSYFYSEKLHEKTTMAMVNVCDFDGLHSLLSKSHVDYIFHLAAQALVDVALVNPRHTFVTNIMGTVNILESARQLGTIKGIVVASSDKAYGKKDSKFSSYVEDDALKGDHPYEASKSAADLIARTYFVTYNLPVVTTRFGNIYGEGDLNFSRIVPGALKAMILGEPLEIRSDGTYFRDYLYVKDVVDGYLKLAEKIGSHAGEAFNFGSSENISVLDAVELIKQVLKKPLPYVILNNARNEIPYQSLDYTKIAKSVGWNPQRSLTDTLPNMYRWYSQYLGNF